MQKHGLSIGIERVDDEFYMTLKAVGKLTHQDYEMITPMIDAALQGVKEPKINALIDVSDMEGWELRAAWDDFTLMLEHGSEFKKVAIFGRSQWQGTVAKMASWFVSGEIRFFEDIKSALMWLND